MEDLITIIIVVIGVAIKIIGSLKKRDPEPESSSETMTWDEFIEAADKDPELQEMINSDPDLQAGLEQANSRKQLTKRLSGKRRSSATQLCLLNSAPLKKWQKKRRQPTNQVWLVNVLKYIQIFRTMAAMRMIPPEIGQNLSAATVPKQW